MKSILVMTLGAVLISGYPQTKIHLMGNKTEEQPYRVVQKRDKFEIRFYPEALLAKVKSGEKSYRSSSSNQFRKLAGFIFGGNAESRQIAMTAPVHMEKTASGSAMHFVMPKAYSMETLPRPLDDGIEVYRSGAGYFAAYSFSGFAGEEKILRAEEELRVLLQDSGIKTIGNFRYLGYNAPYELFNRRNEVIVAVDYEPVAN